MKKSIVVIAVMFLSLVGHAQLSGDIKQDGRKLLTETAFIVEGNHDGRVVFDVAVTIEGTISSVQLVASETTISSTPTRMKARSYVESFEFEKGTHFPKFHQGRVIVTVVKAK